MKQMSEALNPPYLLFGCVVSLCDAQSSLYAIFDFKITCRKAACASHYPLHLFRVFFLNDGGSQKLEKAILDLKHENQRLSSLFYYARKKGPHHHYKAGNQNDGLQYAASINGDLADFVAFLDADMIPDPDWLRALLPHLLRNPKIAFATLPQVRNPISGHQERTHLSSAFTTSLPTIHFSRVWNISSRCSRR